MEDIKISLNKNKLIELICNAHMAGQHYSLPDLNNASYGDAHAYAIHTGIPEIVKNIPEPIEDKTPPWQGRG